MPALKFKNLWRTWILNYILGGSMNFHFDLAQVLSASSLSRPTAHQCQTVSKLKFWCPLRIEMKMIRSSSIPGSCFNTSVLVYSNSRLFPNHSRAFDRLRSKASGLAGISSLVPLTHSDKRANTLFVVLDFRCNVETRSVRKRTHEILSVCLLARLWNESTGWGWAKLGKYWTQRNLVWGMESLTTQKVNTQM